MSVVAIGEVIAALRKEKGVTQEVVAKNVGVSTQAVSKWETGVASPDIALLPAIADYFGVPMDLLFGRERPSALSATPFAQRLARARPRGEVIAAFMDGCWDMQLDYFDPMSERTEAQRNKAKGNDKHSSRIIVKDGFTNVRTGLGCVVMPDPPGGWETVLNAGDAIPDFFSDVSTPGFLSTVAFLAEKHHFSFTPPTIERVCGLDEGQCSQVIGLLAKYRLVKPKLVFVDDEQTTIYEFDAERLPLLLVVLAYAKEFTNERRSFYGYAVSRSEALF